MKIQTTLRYVCLVLLVNSATAQKINPFSQSKKRNPNTEKPTFEYTTSRNHSLNPVKKAFNKYNIDNVTVAVEPSTGLPILLKNMNEGGIQNSNIDNVPTLFYTFMEKYQSNFLIKNVRAEFVMESQEKDNFGITHIKFKRNINHILIDGGEILAHIKNGEIQTINGILYPTPLFQTSKIDKQTAIEKAYKSLNTQWENKTSMNMFKIGKHETTASLVYFDNGNGNLTLTYKIYAYPSLLEHYIVYINASTGEVLQTTNTVCEIDGPKTGTGTDLNGKSRTVKSYQKGSNFYLIDASKPMFNAGRSNIPNEPAGAIWTLDAVNTDGSTIRNVVHNSNNYPNSFAANKAVSAHTNAGIAYDYFRNTHARNSINGQGGTIVSIINVTRKGQQMDNAYWNGEAMFYGNGASAFKPLAGSLDVAGHEMTHGVVGTTAKLKYQGQSGAINESMADVFGAMMDRDDWKLGEDVVRTNVFKSGALRDLSDPHNGGTSRNHNGYQPAKMSEYYSGSADNYGVHINSGIPNHAFYKIAVVIGKSKSEKIYYRALTRYLTSSSKFLALRYAVTQAAEDIHGKTSAEVKAVKSGFDFVEIFDPNEQKGGGNGGTTVKNGEIILPVNPGTESVILVNTDNSVSDIIFKTNPTGTSINALSKKGINKKVSIADDGSFLIFVGTDKKIHRIDLKTNTESIMSNQAIWTNAAISKDGKRLAAVSEDIDTSIWVYDFIKKDWHRIVLYNPTYTKGVDAGGVQYADAIEWDYSGEYILYDAKNLIKNQFGSDIEYWDVGLVKAWDNKTNKFGDGKVEKLYSQLPKDISIGNPTYASNSGHIIAFDYIDNTKNITEYYILANNTATNKTGTIYQNTVISVPDYSNKDNKMIFNARNTNQVPVVAVIPLKASKIEASANPTLLFSGATEATLGVWYANGKRNLLSSDKDIFSYSFPTIKNAEKTIFNGTEITIQVPNNENVVDITALFTHSPRTKVFVGSTEQISGVTKNNFTSPVQYKVVAENNSEKIWTVKVIRNVGFNKIEYDNVSVYPQPATRLIKLNGLTKNTNFQIFTPLGKNVLSGKSYKNEIDISTLKSGIYFIEMGNLKIKFIKN